MPEYRLVLTEVPAPDDIAVVEQGLTSYNEEYTTNDRLPLCVFVKDSGGQVVGGATGRTDRGWLYLDCFWLPEAARKTGLGSRILAAAEHEAKARGCTRARLSPTRSRPRVFTRSMVTWSSAFSKTIRPATARFGCART